MRSRRAADNPTKRQNAAAPGGSELGRGHHRGCAGQGGASGVSGREQETPLFSMPSAPTSSTLPRSRVDVIVHSHSVTSHPAHPGWVDD